MEKYFVFVVGFLLMFTLSMKLEISNTDTTPSKYQIKSRTVLDKFILGLDTYESLNNKILIPNLEIYGLDHDTVKAISIKNKSIKKYIGNVLLVLVNDTLYGVKYYPDDRNVEKYYNHLNDYYESDSIDEWHNEYILIRYNLDTNFKESFTHYDKVMYRQRVK